MGGWGRRLMLINPSGKVLPCHAAEIIPGLTFGNVRVQTLESIWRILPRSNAFAEKSGCRNRARTCDRRTEDFGGCRCQALLLTGGRHGNRSRMFTRPCTPHHRISVGRGQFQLRSFSTRLRLVVRCNSSGPKISGTTAPIPNNRLREKPSYQRTPSVIGRVSVVVPFADPCVSRYSK